jgi:hypothetical protein
VLAEEVTVVPGTGVEPNEAIAARGLAVIGIGVGQGLAVVLEA